MTIPDRYQLRQQLTRHEGLRLKAYRDTVGKLTIGIGRNLDDVGISRDEATYLLAGDISRAEQGLLSRYPDWFPALDSVRQSVLINMVFNLGLSSLAGFTTFLDLMARGQFSEASDDGLQTKWARQVGHRAVELMAQLRTGEWQA